MLHAVFFFTLFSLLDVYILCVPFIWTIWNVLVMVLRCVALPFMKVWVWMCASKERATESGGRWDLIQGFTIQVQPLIWAVKSKRDSRFTSHPHIWRQLMASSERMKKPWFKCTLNGCLLLFEIWSRTRQIERKTMKKKNMRRKRKSLLIPQRIVD